MAKPEGPSLSQLWFWNITPLQSTHPTNLRDGSFFQMLKDRPVRLRDPQLPSNFTLPFNQSRSSSSTKYKKTVIPILGHIFAIIKLRGLEKLEHMWGEDEPEDQELSTAREETDWEAEIPKLRGPPKYGAEFIESLWKLASHSYMEQLAHDPTVPEPKTAEALFFEYILQKDENIGNNACLKFVVDKGAVLAAIRQLDGLKSNADTSPSGKETRGRSPPEIPNATDDSPGTTRSRNTSNKRRRLNRSVKVQSSIETPNTPSSSQQTSSRAPTERPSSRASSVQPSRKKEHKKPRRSHPAEIVDLTILSPEPETQSPGRAAETSKSYGPSSGSISATDKSFRKYMLRKIDHTSAQVQYEMDVIRLDNSRRAFEQSPIRAYDDLPIMSLPQRAELKGKMNDLKRMRSLYCQVEEFDPRLNKGDLDRMLDNIVDAVNLQRAKADTRRNETMEHLKEMDELGKKRKASAEKVERTLKRLKECEFPEAGAT
ncbi:uncharacterized protein F5Z01DRAFT_641095 [Emericellopsis atlantica]|uniref:Uncharacterized protein n=1 Tax=Emericellopsis atlantica TaxID=2614577 RepID=A0A9P7ZD92_9HYPO|nr:uncharacterized protein F5Z01DRAFT_641095 [Emericellopsis atlantica]KAG9249557.1 hypothetical protein F5Z01DRAFT_641095 [Emericellopsis atlantica]